MAEADLSVIESELGKPDFLAEYQFGQRGDGHSATFGRWITSEGRDDRGE